MKSCIVYYTCNTHKSSIDEACREQLLKAGLPIVAISLNKDLNFGDIRVTVGGVRGPEMMHEQVLMGLEGAKGYDNVFLCESDVLYHPSHFDFTPQENYIIYYNQNVWKYRYPDGFTFKTQDMRQVSGICADRLLLLDFYTKRVKQIEKEGFNRHYEPGIKQTVGTTHTKDWSSQYPNICIRHDSNITKSKFSPEEFRNPKYAQGWQETGSDKVPGWGDIKEILKD